MLQPTEKPTILFVLSQKLGWASYSRSLEEMARQQDAFEPVFYHYRPHRLWSIWSKKIHARGIKGQMGCLDPMRIAGWQIGRWWNQQGKSVSPDAIHAVTHVPGYAFVRQEFEIPLSVTVDCTRRLVASDFKTTCFGPNAPPPPCTMQTS